MAATIATCLGIDKTGRRKEDHRLGSRAAEARAATWRTSAIAWIEADGRGMVQVKRDGQVIHTYEFGPEVEGEDR